MKSKVSGNRGMCCAETARVSGLCMLELRVGKIKRLAIDGPLSTGLGSSSLVVPHVVFKRRKGQTGLLVS